MAERDETVHVIKTIPRRPGAARGVNLNSNTPTMMGVGVQDLLGAAAAQDARSAGAMHAEPVVNEVSGARHAASAACANEATAGWSGGPGYVPPAPFDAPVDVEPERDSGERRSMPSREHAVPRSASRELARIEPQPFYEAPPPPPWLRVETGESVGERSPRLVMLNDPQSLAAQQFRSLRYRVEREPDAQLIGVCSPRDGEGKSITAANLALALGEGGRQRVLLIDAALKAPKQAEIFGVAEHAGLTTVLASLQRGEPTAVDVIGIAGSLHLLPAGPPVRSIHAVLSSNAAAQLVGMLRRAFRYIVVDCSAVYGSGETLAWHGMIDRYIMVARGGRTTVEDLGKAADRLGRDKVLGVTLVGAPARSFAQ